MDKGEFPEPLRQGELKLEDVGFRSVRTGPVRPNITAVAGLTAYQSKDNLLLIDSGGIKAGPVCHLAVAVIKALNRVDAAGRTYDRRTPPIWDFPFRGW